MYVCILRSCLRTQVLFFLFVSLYIVFYCIFSDVLHGLLLLALAILLLLWLFSIVVVGTLGRAQCGQHSSHKGGEMGIG